MIWIQNNLSRAAINVLGNALNFNRIIIPPTGIYINNRMYLPGANLLKCYRTIQLAIDGINQVPNTPFLVKSGNTCLPLNAPNQRPGGIRLARPGQGVMIPQGVNILSIYDGVRHSVFVDANNIEYYN